MKLFKPILVLFFMFAFSNTVAASPAYSYLKSTIQSLDAALEARELFRQGAAQTFEKNRLFDMSKAIDKAVIKVERARMVIERYKESGDPIIKRSAFYFIRGYSAMEQALAKLNEVIKEEIGSTTGEISKKNLQEMEKYIQYLGRIGKNIHNAAVLASYSALDQKRQSNQGGWTHVLLTRSEYDELAQMLNERFKEMSIETVDLESQPEKAAFITLAQFLSNNWLTQGESETSRRVDSMQLFNREELAKLNQPQESENIRYY